MSYFPTKKDQKTEVIPTKTEPLEESVVQSPVTPVQEVKTEQRTDRKVDDLPKIILNQTDAYVYERMKAQPRNLEGVKVTDEGKDPNKHQLSLPKEFDKFGKKYAFRWIMKSKKAIDEACDIRGWTLINRGFFPDLPEHYFTVSGSMERGDLILGFMPQERAEKLRQEPRDKSNDMLETTFSKHKQDPRFYTPEDEGKTVQMI